MSGESLLELAQFALSEAVRAGAEAADVSVARGRSLEVEFFAPQQRKRQRPPRPPGGALRPVEVISKGADGPQGRLPIEIVVTVREGVNATVRCFVKGGRGVHVCDGLERGDLAHAAAAAVSAARAAGPDPDFRGLPGPQPAGLVPDLYDERVAEISVEDAARVARACAERAFEVAGDVNVSGAISFVASQGAFVNSLGVESAEHATSISADVMCVVRRGGETGTFAEFDAGRSLDVVDLEAVGELAARGALRYLGPRKTRGGMMPLVTGPLVTGGLLESLAQAASAEAVQRGRSFLCPYAEGRHDRRVARSVLTLEDDGRWPGGLHSSSRDGEGTPRRPLAIIERGVLVNLLHNSYTAGKAGVKSTGHGTQLGGVAPTNLRPRVGSRPAEAMIAQIKEGLYLDSTMLSPHPVTGEISAIVDWAFKIENGELAYPVTGVAVAGDVMELLASLDEISSDYREEPGSVMPTMLFGGVRVVGAS